MRQRGENFANTDRLKRLAAHATSPGAIEDPMAGIIASGSLQARGFCRTAVPNGCELPALELGAAAEAELLNPIVALFHKRE